MLFGRLKNGGVVRVVVTGDDAGVKKLGFVYPEGPAQPRLERDLFVAGRERAKGEGDAPAETRKPRSRKSGEGPSDPDDGASQKSPSEPQTT